MGILDIYFAPGKAFTALKEKPRWIVPLAIVLVVVALTAVLTVNLAREEITMRQEEVMRERGLTEEQMEQARQFTQGPVAVLSGALSAAIFTVILLLAFTVVTNLFVPLFGGESGFKKVIPSAILKLIMIAITKSPYVTTSLAMFAPALGKDSFTYQLLAGFDFFVIWEMILVSMGISVTNGITKKNAYILVFVIWLVSIFVGIGLGKIFGRGM
jgi:hypothetical protein